MSTQNVYPLSRPTPHPAVSLRILRAIPPEPHYGSGTYEVRLQLSRPLTADEGRALRPISRGLHVIGDKITVRDTTLERVAGEAPGLAALMTEVEAEGRRLEEEATQRSREFARTQLRESARMADLAATIDFRA